MALLEFHSEEDKKILYNELVDVSKFIQSWAAMSNFDFSNDQISVDEHIQTLMSNIDEEVLSNVAERCSEKNLECGFEDYLKLPGFGDYLPDEIDLVAVKLQKEELEKRKESPKYRNLINRKHRKRDFFTHLLSPNNKDVVPENKIVTLDAVLQVAMYKPTKRLGTNVTRTLGLATAALESVYAVLGQQKLSQLRDRIRCMNDVLVTGDYSDNPDLDTSVCAWDVFKSGTFFIENVFYDDTRQPDNLKYSKEIIEWAAEAGAEYTCKIMEETKFNELSVRIGRPYLYLHQGNCEHLLVFSDIRMVHPHDNLDITEYPCLLQRSYRKRTICRVCAFASARWRIVNSEHALESISFFCDVCFRSLHYDKDGNKLGNFKAYKYFDEHTVL